jgi:Cu(I)/Ag(I) efflux system membrane fusion protein
VVTLQWPAMTMGFSKPSPSTFPDIKPGDRVRLEFKAGGPSGYELGTVQKLAAGAGK